MEISFERSWFLDWSVGFCYSYFLLRFLASVVMTLLLQLLKGTLQINWMKSLEWKSPSAFSSLEIHYNESCSCSNISTLFFLNSHHLICEIQILISIKSNFVQENRCCHPFHFVRKRNSRSFVHLSQINLITSY